MGITDFFGTAKAAGKVPKVNNREASPLKGGGVSRVERFAKACKGRSKADQRRLEASLLAPEEIPPYTGPEASTDARKPLSARAVKFTFHRVEDMALFKRHFRVSKFVELSVADPSFLLRILHALESKEITYDKEKDKFTT